MRKAKPRKRILLPDPKFNDVEVTRFVNNLMLEEVENIPNTMLNNNMPMIDFLFILFIFLIMNYEL